MCNYLDGYEWNIFFDRTSSNFVFPFSLSPQRRLLRIQKTLEMRKEKSSPRRLQVGRIDRRRRKGGWRGGDGVAIDETFGLNYISLNCKSDAQISRIGLFIFKINSG